MNGNYISKKKIVCIFLGVAIFLYVGSKLLFKDVIVNKYQSCQTMSINGNILQQQQQKITKDILCSVLEKTYFENKQSAGFNSRYIAVNHFEDLTWKKVYCPFRLAYVYNIDVEYMSEEMLSFVENIANTIDYEKVTIPEMYELLILDETYDIVIDRSKVEERLESFYCETEGLYRYGKSVSDELKIEATYFAILIYEKLSKDIPHRDKIFNSLQEINVSKNLFGEDYYPEYWILAMKELNCNRFDNKFITKYEKYLGGVVKKYREQMEKGILIDSIELFYSYYRILAAEAIGVKPAVYINTLKDMISHISYSDILTSKEITDAAIWLDKNKVWEIDIFDAVEEQVKIYVVNSFEMGVFKTMEEEIGTNPMDTYYGICLSDLCGFIYDKNKIRTQLDSWLQEHLNQDVSNRNLYLFFDLLVSEKVEYKLSKIQVQRIKKRCIDYFMRCENIELSEDENIVWFLEQTLFVMEICKLIDYDISNENREMILSSVSRIINDGKIKNTSFVSECRLILNILGDDMPIYYEDETCSNLLVNGGYASIQGENLENIVSTGKMARVDDYMKYLDTELLKSFLDSFVINDKLRYNRQEVGADLRTYYWYLGLYSISDSL